MSGDLTLTFGTEPIVAYRTWTTGDFVHRDGRTEKWLAPLNGASPNQGWWPPLEPSVGRCRSHLHAAPWPDCACGLWAVREQKDLQMNGDYVIGEVYLWGRVCEFEKGFRAQYAYPKSLVCLGSTRAEQLAHYGVPVSNPTYTVYCTSCKHDLYRLDRHTLGPVLEMKAHEFIPVEEAIPQPVVGEEIKCPLCNTGSSSPAAWMGIRANL